MEIIIIKLSNSIELEHAFSIRKNVFVEEQGVPLEDEFDQFDTLNGTCEHVLAYIDGIPIGTGRVRCIDGKGKLERICILEPYRKFGVGKKIINTLEEISKDKGFWKVKLHGQSQAKGFYEKLGYTAISDEFMEDGIPHFLMIKDLMKSKKIDSIEGLNIAFQIREEVFVKEQNVPLEDEFDDYDKLDGQCEHILVYFNKLPAGTGRIIIRDGVGKLDRICILKPYRQYGLGKLIVTSLEEIAENKGISKVKLHGQTHAEGFYHKLGYQTTSDVFMEDGIPHYLMVKDLLWK